jgi:hypothetical protein
MGKKQVIGGCFLKKAPPKPPAKTFNKGVIRKFLRILKELFSKSSLSGVRGSAPTQSKIKEKET